MENPAFILELDEKSENIKNETKSKSEKVYSFEEAVALTGTGKFHYFLTIVSGLCFMTVMVETMGISISMPLIKCDLESSIVSQGILASSGFLGIVLSSHAMGFLADTWGRVKTLRIAVALGFITTVISAFSVNIWMLIVFRILNGLVISGCQACVFSFLGEFHGIKTRVKNVTLLSMFMPLGLVFLPSMAIWILPMEYQAVVFGMPFQPWRVLLLANSILSLLALSGLFLMPESPKFILIQGRNEEAIRTFRKMFRINTGKAESEYPVMEVYIEITGANLREIGGVKDACKLIWGQTVPLFNKERVLHTLNICFIMFIIFSVAQGTFMWFPTILDQLVLNAGQGYTICEILTMSSLGNASADNATAVAGHCSGTVDTFMFVVLLIIGVAFTFIYLTFALVIDKVGKKPLLLIWLFLSVGCCLAIHWVTSFVLSVILLTLVIAIGNCGGIVSTISIEYFPTNVNAMGMCLIMMLGRLGAVAGSNFVGLVVFNSCDLLFYVYMALIGAIGFLSCFLPDKKKPKMAKILNPKADVHTIRQESIKQLSDT